MVNSGMRFRKMINEQRRIGLMVCDIKAWGSTLLKWSADLKMFSRHQLLVFLYEDFLTAPRDMLGKIFDFLDVDTEFKPHLTARRNISGIPRWRWVFNVCRKLSRWNRVVGDYAWVNASITRLDQINLRRISLDPELKHELTLAYYKEDILTLQEMLNRDLSNWLS